MFALITIVILWAIVFGVLWIKMHTIVWWEWLTGVAIGFVTVGCMFSLIQHNLTDDIETWSGYVVSVQHEPRWKSWYMQEHTSTSGSGENAVTTTYYTRETKSEGPRWWAETTLGRRSITETQYADLKQKFGGEEKTKGSRPSYDSGPKEDYLLVNINKYIQPLTDTHAWENKVRAAPSVFNYPRVPEGSAVYKWPDNPDIFRSDRLIGVAVILGPLNWDRMNARLGPSKKVNVIAIGFPPGTDSGISQLQEAAWVGGKKNDLVLCFAGNPGKKAEWSYVFGWSEEALVKRNLESLLILNEVNADLIPAIEKEIRANYIIKDWAKFDYLDVEVPLWGYLTTFFILVLTQGGLFWFFHSNEITEYNPMGDSHEYSRYKNGR